MKFLSQLLAALLLLSFIACNQNKNAKDSLLGNSDVALKKVFKNEEEKQVPMVLDSSGLQNSQTKQSPLQVKTGIKEDWDKKIIKTATLSIEVKNYKNFNELLRPAIKQFGGYVAQEEQNQSDYKIENIITIKVPVDQFDNAVSYLTPVNEKVIEKKITSDDVTTEMVDTKSRMESKKRVRDRYLDLLKQAKNMAEILQVQNEVNDIQEQVESAAGRIEYLGHSSAYSTIHLTFYQVLNASAGNTADPGYATRIAESFKSGLKWFGELFIVMVSFWPLWIVVVSAWFIIKKYKSSIVKKA